MFRNLLRPGLIFIFCLHLATSWAWGPGHDDIQRALLDRLPTILTSGLDEDFRNLLVREYSHYPDHFGPFDESLIGSQSLERLLALGITKRYDLHHDRNRAIAFLELIHAIREKEYRRANFWIACMAHSTADMAAINHDPMTHTVYYLWGKERAAVRTAQGNFPGYLDIHDLAETEAGLRIFNEQISKMAGGDTHQSLLQVLATIMFYGHEGAHFLAQRGFAILSDAISYADQKDEKTQLRLFQNMSDLGAWAVSRTLRDVQIALRFAASGIDLQFPEEAERIYLSTVDQHLRSRTLDDGMFAALWTHATKLPTEAIGILTEPSWRMNDALIGFTERVLSFQIANSLRNKSKAFRMLNIAEVLTQGFPDPASTPTLILPVRSSKQSYHWMKMEDLTVHLDTYLKKGGRVIWIGGTPPLVQTLSDAMIRRGDGEDPFKVMEDAELLTSAETIGILSGELKPKVGWLSAGCPYVFKDETITNKSLQPLLYIRNTSQETEVTGVSWPANNPKVVFLPTYALIPFLWTSHPELPNPIDEASLDEAGERILMMALQAFSGQ